MSQGVCGICLSAFCGGHWDGTTQVTMPIVVRDGWGTVSVNPVPPPCDDCTALRARVAELEAALRRIDPVWAVDVDAADMHGRRK